jgi:hypothetical protein
VRNKFKLLVGLKNLTSWRTFIVGLVIGYTIAWGIHWATRLRDINGIWWDEEIPVLTPHWGRN